MIRRNDHTSISSGDDTAPNRRRLQWILIGRVAVATILLGATLYFGGAHKIREGGFTPTFLLILTSLIYTSSIVFGIWLLKQGSLRAIAAGMMALDLVLITGLVYLTGGAGSIFSTLYGVAILMSAMTLGPIAAYVTAASSLTCHLALGVGLAVGRIPSPPDQPLGQYVLSTGDLSYALLSNMIGIAVVALLAAGLASRLQSTGGRLLAAQQSAARLARLNDDIVRSIASGLITADTEDRILGINPAAREMLHDLQGELIGRPLAAVLADADEYRSGERTRRADSIARRPDGTEFPIGYSISSLVDIEGQHTGKLLVFQDLTEIRELRDKAEQAERLAVLGRLAVGLAHEIRNPLSSISGSVDLVRDNPDINEQDGRLLGIVVGEVERLNELVTTMLQVGRPSHIHPAPTDLRPVIRDVVTVAQADASMRRSLRIKTRLPDEPVRASIDPDRMRQVVWNLVKNAIQASPVGGTIEVALGFTDKERVFLEVSDEGSGIEEQQKKHLFDMFYSGKTYGIGLGLAFVKQIADQHGATIEVGDRTGGGTRFRMLLHRIPDNVTALRASS